MLPQTGEPWTFEQIQEEWFGNASLRSWDQEDVVRAFNVAESICGRNWVLGSDVDAGVLAIPGIGRRGGFSEFLRVYWFGARMEWIVGAIGSDDLMRRVLAGDAAASEEASAIHLLRSKQIDTQLEIAPSVRVGARNRQPDFRLRNQGEPWIYVEVTKLNESNASIRIEDLLQRIVEGVMTVDKEFLLEIVFNRDPSDSEEEEILAAAKSACNAADGYRKDVGDLASILAKAGDPAVVVPSLIPEDDRPRTAISRSVVGAGQPNRQILARIPFQDQRAEHILKDKARQLPENECGIVMVNANRQPSALESWSERVPERFAGGQHTRVAAVILFMHAATVSSHNDPVWIASVRLIANPHAAVPLPSWIADSVSAIRADAKRLTLRSD